MNWLPVFVIIAAAVLVFYIQRCSLSCDGRDNYGQDASIRASAGWAAGPMYGYDPINRFAEEIAMSKTEFRRKVNAVGCKGACDGGTQSECGRCLDTAGVNMDEIETLVIGIMPLEGDAPQNPRPGYKKKKYPYWVPPEAEFDEDYSTPRKRNPCTSCS